MEKTERKTQRSLAVPEYIDRLAEDIMADEPWLSRSQALQKILQAGKRAIESERRAQSGNTQIDVDALARMQGESQ